MYLLQRGRHAILRLTAWLGFYVCEVRTARVRNLKETAARLAAGIFWVPKPLRDDYGQLEREGRGENASLQIPNCMHAT